MRNLNIIFIFIFIILMLNKPVYASNSTVNLEETHIYEGNYYIDMLKPTRNDNSIKNKHGEIAKIYSYTSYLPQCDIMLISTYCDYSEPHEGQMRRNGYIISDFLKEHEIGVKMEYGPRLGKLEKYIGNSKKLWNGMQESTLVFRVSYNNEKYILCSKLLLVDKSHFYQIDYIGNIKYTSLLEPKKWMESFRLDK